MRKSKISKLDNDSELEDKSLECHELKVMNNMLQETLQKVVAVVEAAKEDKEKLTEKIKFQVSSVKRSTEETLNMERKLLDAKKSMNKNVNQSNLLCEKLDTLEHSNKLLKEKNDKLQHEKKLSEAHNDFHLVSSKISKAGLSLYSSSPESSIIKSVPEINLYATKKPILQVSSTSYSDSRKPFTPSPETQDLLTFKPFPALENVVPGKPFPPN